MTPNSSPPRIIKRSLNQPHFPLFPCFLIFSLWTCVPSLFLSSWSSLPSCPLLSDESTVAVLVCPSILCSSSSLKYLQNGHPILYYSPSLHSFWKFSCLQKRGRGRSWHELYSFSCFPIHSHFSFFISYHVLLYCLRWCHLRGVDEVPSKGLQYTCSHWYHTVSFSPSFFIFLLD